MPSKSTTVKVVDADSLFTERRSKPNKLGRKRDDSRDGDILSAALEVLADLGYDRMTMDIVAERAKAGKATLYRRWPSKADLVLDTVAWMGRREVDLQLLPDTGTFRGDMVALIRPKSLAETDRKLRVIGGLTSMLSAHPEFAEAANAATTGRWVDANRALMLRAVDRGEFSKMADIETLAHVVPSMASYRASFQQKPIDRKFLIGLIDGVLLPALKNAGNTRAKR